MAALNIHDETFVAAAPGVLRRAIVDADVVSRWFPGLRAVVFMDRGEKGVRWSVAGEIDGSLEVWLEQVGRGTVVHWFVRGDGAASDRHVGRLQVSYMRTLNAQMFTLKDVVETADPAQ